MNNETIKAAREALDSLDDYARMNTGVDAHGPRGALEAFISAAEHSLSAQDRVLTDNDLTQEFSLKTIIDGLCYDADEKFNAWEDALNEYIRVECNRAVAAAAPSPAVAESVPQLICPACGKNRFKETCPSSEQCPMIADAHSATTPPSLAVRDVVDAARYRFLRDNGVPTTDAEIDKALTVYQGVGLSSLLPDEIDAAIDAAMREQP